MIRTLIMLLAILTAMTSCANLNEEETIPEEYVPEVDYTDYAVYSTGASIILDRDTVRKKPLIKYKKYCDLEDIEFDLGYPFDERFIDFDALGAVKTEVSGGDSADAARPNGNFLTDGETRKKLCTDKICRENDDYPCTHINLVGGHVWGNYVYYIGKYKAEDQTKLQWSAEYENYLMRYCIPDNEVEVVARLPWFCYITQAAYGVLYIAYLEDVPFKLYQYNYNTLVYDCENVRLALVEGLNGLFLAESEYGSPAWDSDGFYYIQGRKIFRRDYDLSGQVTIGEVESGMPKMLGYGKNRVFYTLTDYSTGVTSVRSLKDDGRRRIVIESCTDAALVNDYISTYLYVIEGKEIARYKLDRLGMGEERSVVFTESDKLDVNEHLQSIEAEKGAVYFTTTVGQYTNHTRTYLLTEQGAVLDHESGAPVTEENDDEAAAP